MNHRFVNQLSDAEEVLETYRAADKQLRPNRNGNLYLQVQLSDRSGSITGMMWNASEKVYRSFDNGDYVLVDGTAQVYNGTLQIIVGNIKKTNQDNIEESDFLPLSQEQIGQMTSRLKEMLRATTNYHLRNLTECFLMDEEFLRKFTSAPAGVKIHHAYCGGLLEHVVNLMEVVLLIAPRFPDIDVDLLKMGAFLHDMGKLDELSYERDLSYTDEGQLLGHALIGVHMLDEKIVQAEELSGDPIPEEIVLRLKHMIVSHHGEYAYGSVKLPMTIEAIALHYLDSMDARIHSFRQLLLGDANSDSHWTTYQAHLGRKLFKGDGSGQSR